MILVENLRKAYRGVVALDGLDLDVAEGSITALLGPNGAGKSTLIRILATLLRPDSGRAEVGGRSVTAQPYQVRALIGLTGQFTAVDDLLTGHENLVLVGRLYRLPRKEAHRLADDLLAAFDLGAAAGRRAGTYSGGMRRRLDLAASLMTRPRALFLDEPTTGLDPRSRRTLWSAIRRLPEQGTTILLTTQYLEEADRLASAVTVIDRGRSIATGTPEQLKARAGGARAEVVLADPRQAPAATEVMSRYGTRPTLEGETVTVPVAESVLPDLLRDLDAAGVPITGLALRRPTLDDAFLALTGGDR
ncbi:ATP-binding cassette domain-containing protein [Nonomuraea sp. NPDC050394]|uniref:ATP-binding cassette domain-containing protein n=1 Tax=Nonomuraea sp. NPDC050394 TaxID=3364363 RepID=UPI003793E29E